jgi:hypothetical protein
VLLFAFQRTRFSPDPVEVLLIALLFFSMWIQGRKGEYTAVFAAVSSAELPRSKTNTAYEKLVPLLRLRKHALPPRTRGPLGNMLALILRLAESASRSIDYPKDLDSITQLP